MRFRADGQNIGIQDTTAPYSVVWDTSAVSTGSHTLTAVAADAAGNAATSDAVNVTVPDTTAPETTISSGPSGTVSSNSASFSFSSSEPGSTFECRLDSGRVESLQFAGVLLGTRQRQPHLRGPRERQRRQHRQHPGLTNVDGVVRSTDR